MFRRDPADRAFARYCRSGDPDALASVFDLTAGELLRVALWLCGNRADAEDLLQRTFLAAIEGRERFDRRQRVLPWLCAIVVNHARGLQRDRARRERAVATPAAAAADPAEVAARRELSERLARLRSELASPYREVLELHLEQGLGGKEIAARLGRPAGTVRTQLVRAFELLRRRLPSGFVAGLMPFAPEAAVLAKVKLAVVDAAQGTTPSAATATSAAPIVGGTFMSKNLLAAPAALLLLSLGIYAVWPAVGNPPAPTPPTVATLSETAAEVAAPGQAAPLERTPLAAPFDAEPGFGSLRVVVRWQDDDSPAAGVGVSARLSDYTWQRRDGITDAEGACILPHLRPAGWQATCSHATDDCVVTIAAGELGTVELIARREATVHGRVVDPAGAPVSDARVWVAEGRGPDERQYVLVHSDASGRFALPVTGRQLIGARKHGMAPSLARSIDASAGDQDIVLHLRGGGASVRGTVRDANGQTLAWARVHVGECMQLWGVAGPFENAVEALGEQCLTDADGAFAFDGVRPERAALRVWAAGHAPHGEELHLLPGQRHGLDIALSRGAVVHGRVRSADGQPVDAALVQAETPLDAWNSPFSTRSDRAGRFQLRDLPAGDVTLRASLRGRGVQAALHLSAGATTEWDATLDPSRSIRGRVLGPDGAPMADVQLGPMSGRDIHPRRLTTTDAAGRFVLEVGDEPVLVQVGDLAHEPLKRVADVAPGTEDLEIRIEHRDLPTARLRGRFVDDLGYAVETNIEVCNQPGVHVIRDVKTDATGAFELGPLRPGRRELLVRTLHLGCVPVAPIELGPDETRDLGTITVRRPGSATFTVMGRDGKPIASGNLRVTSRDHASPVGWTEIKDGHAAIAALPPGTWRVLASGANPAELQIESGENTHLLMVPGQR